MKTTRANSATRLGFARPYGRLGLNGVAGRKRTGSFGALAAVAALAGSMFAATFAIDARAQPSIADKSVATQLFKEGRALLDEGHIAQACRKLEESQRLEPGGGTLLNLALCHEKEGRTASAWVEFTEALGIAKRDDRPQRVEFARAHIAQIEPTLSRLNIQVAPGSDVPDLEVKRDGSIVGRAAWGSPVPVDPGTHLVEASAPGSQTWTQVVTIGPNAETKTVVVPPLEVVSSAPTASAMRAAPSGPAPSPTASAKVEPLAGDAPKTTDAPAAPSSTRRVVAWTALAVGVVGAGFGTYFGLHALSQKSDADRECPGDACSANGARLTSQAIQSANASTAAFAVGVAGLGTAAVLFVIDAASSHAEAPTPKSPDEAGLRVTRAGVSLGSGHAGFDVSGSF